MNIKKIILALSLLFLVTGCTKKLTCTLAKEEGISEKTVVFFEDDKATKVNIHHEITLEGEKSDKEIENLKKEFKQSYEVQGYENIDINYKKAKLIISAEIKAEKYLEDLKTIDEIKKYFVEQDYTCK